MICDLCGKKKATVHLTEIVDEQMLEMHLCEECARERVFRWSSSSGYPTSWQGWRISGSR